MTLAKRPLWDLPSSLMSPNNDRHPGARRSRAGAGKRVLSVILMLSLSLSCGGARTGAKRATTKFSPDVARYRLLLRENPIDPAAAFRCYGSCQSLDKPDTYLGCLTKCPGFEVTKGFACAPYELPPDAVCITARRLPDRQEIGPDYKVVAVIANVALIVALGVACTSSTTCGAYRFAAPGQRPVSPGY